MKHVVVCMLYVIASMHGQYRHDVDDSSLTATMHAQHLQITASVSTAVQHT